MDTIYYESIDINNFKLLLAYTKDYIVRLQFNYNEIASKEFYLFLQNNSDKIVKIDKKSEYKLMIENYLLKKSQSLSAPVKLIGSDFQKRVWRMLMEIPYGKLKTYGEIAKEIGNEKASRAVGNANNKNNIVLIVPCHRVIGSNNSLVGFAPGIEYKAQLLSLEGHAIVKRITKKVLYYVE